MECHSQGADAFVAKTESRGEHQVGAIGLKEVEAESVPIKRGSYRKTRERKAAAADSD